MAEIARLCERYGVERLDLFGSAAEGGFDSEKSDLDFVVRFEKREPCALFDRYFGLNEDLEALFGRGVDLVTEGAVAASPQTSSGAGCHCMGLEERIRSNVEDVQPSPTGPLGGDPSEKGGREEGAL